MKEAGRKAKRHQAIEKLITDIREVDADRSLSIGKKNVKHKLSANRYMTAMKDGRKSIINQISNNTLKRYITDARNAITEQQWLHYSFHQTIERLTKQFPLFAEEIQSIEKAGAEQDKPLDAIREQWKQVVDKMKDGNKLLAPLLEIDVVKTGWKKEVLDLAEKDSYGWEEKTANREKKHGYWVAELQAVTKSKEPKAALDALNAKLAQATSDTCYDKVRFLKIDHEIMRHLKLSEKIKAVNADNDKRALNHKKKSEKVIDYLALMPTINALLNAEPWMPEYWQALSIGLIMATGRRPVEVLLQGRFKKAGSYELIFSGQAKRSGGVDYSDSFKIYTLVPADKVLEAVAKLRSIPKIKELTRLTAKPNLSINQLVANRTSVQLNAFMDSLIERNNWPDMSAKHGRALYAKICVDLFRHNDPRWQGYMEDAMVSELLGHDDEKAQQYYRDWHVLNAGSDYKTIEYQSRGSILQELDKLDEVMFIADQSKPNGARAKLHKKVKAVLKENPDTEITNRFIRNQIGGSPHTIKAYLELAEPALQNEFDLVQFIGKQVGTLNANDTSKAPSQPINTDQLHGKPEPEPEPEPEQDKPLATEKAAPKLRFKDKGHGEWLVTVTDNQVVFEYLVKAKQLSEAWEKAWTAHSKAQQKNKTYSAEVYFAKGALIPVLEVEVSAENEKLAKVAAEKQMRAGGIQAPINKIIIKLKR